MTKENKESTAKEGNIVGTNTIDKSKENTFLKKEEIMFQVDEDGVAIAEEMEIEVYDKSIDDELLFTTMELDNALTMYDSIKVAFKSTMKLINAEISKSKEAIIILSKEEKPQLEVIKGIKKQIEDKNLVINKISSENGIKISAYTIKINECRADLNFLEKKRDSEKVLRKIKAIPCTVSEAYKYFNKNMWKNDKGEWQNPIDKEDKTFISHLLSDKVAEPKLTIKEWDLAKPQMRMCFKDAIGDISEYHKASPKEILVNNRRSEKLKNFDGELQD